MKLPDDSSFQAEKPCTLSGKQTHLTHLFYNIQFVVVCFVKATVPNSKLFNSTNDRQAAEFYRLWVILLEKVRKMVMYDNDKVM